jgi:hypothetical protein
MKFNPLNFVVASSLLKKQGIESQRSNQIAIVSSFLPLVPGVVVAKVVGQREAPQPTAPTIADYVYVVGEPADNAFSMLYKNGFRNVRINLQEDFNVNNLIVLEQVPKYQERIRYPVNTLITLTIH